MKAIWSWIFSLTVIGWIGQASILVHAAGYTPSPVFCAGGTTPSLCSTVPAYIGADPELKPAVGYSGLFTQLPTNANQDVQTPFDNMAWQMFVALNWTAGAESQPAATGLLTNGARVWQTYPKISDPELFGPAAKLAQCKNPNGLPVLTIGATANGTPSGNNEEYFQASTNLPLVDINGNWTIYERRVNSVEAEYLKHPMPTISAANLTTLAGQLVFISNQGVVKFPASDPSPTGKVGSMEIKTSWRILVPGKDDPTRYFAQKALIAVTGALVNGGRDLCTEQVVGLVGMHIIERNQAYAPTGNLQDKWFWASFEHVDNAPLAKNPCDITNAANPCPASNGSNAVNPLNQPSCGPADPLLGTHYSYYDPAVTGQGTNIAPVSKIGNNQFPWNSQAPFAQGNMTDETGNPQATRCWSIYALTAQTNQQWQAELAQATKGQAPWSNYMLISNQWGGKVEPPTTTVLPTSAVPALLSNTTLETYIQMDTGATNAGPGSCVDCHNFATLAVALPGAKASPKSDFSFLPGLADKLTARPVQFHRTLTKN